MQKKNQTIIALVLLPVFFLLLAGIGLAQEKQLETTYPTIQGFKPETITTNLAQYVKYIFNFAVAIVGLIAFGSLVWAGIHYLTSTSQPEELKKGKKRIQAALLGLLILLFSYLILTTINPQLIAFKLPGLIQAPVTPVATSTPISEATPDVYEKIGTLVNALSSTTASIESQVNSLNDQINQCNCSNAKSMCVCQGAAVITPATTTPATTTCSSDQQTRSEIVAADIRVNKTCQDPSSCSVSGGQTCLYCLQSCTISGVEAIKQNCNCDVTITGGSECGHAGGTYSHGNGYKTDLRPNTNLNNYIQQQGCSTTPDTNCKGKDGNIYRYETAGGAHWDVCYCCST